MSTITPSTIVSDLVSGDNLSLAPLDYFFGPVGGNRPTLQVESVWSTSIEAGRSRSEQRYQNRDRPYRRINLVATAFDREESMALQTLLARMGQRRFLAPLFSDESPVTGSLSASDTSITCVTDYRRFFQGGRVVVYRRKLAAGVWPEYEVATISSVGSGTLTLAAGLSNSYASPVFVAPLIECELQLGASGGYRFFTDYECDVVVRERVGPMSIPALVTPGSNPSGFATSGGIPILDPLGMMTKSGRSGFNREGTIVDVGLGTVPDVYGERATMEYEVGLEFTARSDAWDFLRFAESRAGRAYPFWMVSPSETLTLTSSTIGATLSVKAFGDVDDWATYRPALAVREHDGTVTLIDLEGATVTVNGTNHDITLASAVSPAIDAADVERLSIARKCRFKEDAILEEWQTANYMRCTVGVVELLEEKDITIANLDRQTSTGLTESFVPGTCPGEQLPLEAEEGCTTCEDANMTGRTALVSGLDGSASVGNGTYTYDGPSGQTQTGDVCSWNFTLNDIPGVPQIVMVYHSPPGGSGGTKSIGNTGNITLAPGEYAVIVWVQNPSVSLIYTEWSQKTTTLYCGEDGVLVGSHTFTNGPTFNPALTGNPTVSMPA